MGRDQEADAVAEEAIDWMVLARSGAMDARSKAELEAWLARDARHRQAWDALHVAIGGPWRRISDIEARHPGQARHARDLLVRPRRRALLGALVAASGACLLAAVDRETPLRTLVADLRTGTGERRRFGLADGSALTLNARSAADASFGDRQRHLRLRAGDMLLDAAPDPRRALQVACGGDRVRTRDASFSLRQEAAGAVVAVHRGRVELAAAGGAAWAALPAGRIARFRASRIEPLPGMAGEAPDWSEGRLSVIDVPLAEVVARLRPYRRDLLRLAPEAAGLRVQGVFPLDDTGRALRALEETLPIRVRRAGPVTLIDAA